ncbi:MAG: 3-phosphoshikimate 1-carboxyvinyltransferase [Dehalococcoidia bacterium]|nr:3-phosphoshikimate 1-carboxyvinyltransferase [Dehalococcoidia bacterium]
MKAVISKSKIHGKTAAPSSKSYTLRGLICAALAEGQSEIIHPLEADDTIAAREVLDKIGVGVRDEGGLWAVNGGKFRPPGCDLYCHDSAGTLRFMMAVCATVPGTCILTAGHSLSRRPLGPLATALQDLSIDCSTDEGKAPVTIKGGKLQGGRVTLDGDISSQFVSALMFIAPLAENGMTIELTSRVESRPYIMMTRDCMKTFGIDMEHNLDFTRMDIPRQKYRPSRYYVEGDWSSASYLLALGAVAGETEVLNLYPKSRQADCEIWILLNRMGANMKAGHGALMLSQSVLHAFRADLTDCIDLLPTLASLAAVTDGVSELTGILRARLKESDRISAMREGLQRMGIQVTEEPDRLLITGGTPHGAVIDSKGDHRIAMAFSILGVLAGDTIIEDAGCVNKTFPAYWEVLKSLGGKVTLNG